MPRSVRFLLVLLVASLVGGIAAYVVFMAPVLFFGEDPSRLVGWGFITAIPAGLAFFFVGGGLIFACRSFFGD